jgi:hypothetical protein
MCSAFDSEYCAVLCCVVHLLCRLMRRVRRGVVQQRRYQSWSLAQQQTRPTWRGGFGQLSAITTEDDALFHT